MVRKFFRELRSTLAGLDFSEVKKDMADDLKKASYVAWTLWGLSKLSSLPPQAGVVLSALGVSSTALVVSPWVSWLLLAVAVSLYAAQLVLRVKRKDVVERQVSIRNPLKRFANDAPRRGLLAWRNRSSDLRVQGDSQSEAD